MSSESFLLCVLLLVSISGLALLVDSTSHNLPPVGPFIKATSAEFSTSKPKSDCKKYKWPFHAKPNRIFRNLKPPNPLKLFTHRMKRHVPSKCKHTISRGVHLQDRAPKKHIHFSRPVIRKVSPQHFQFKQEPVFVHNNFYYPPSVHKITNNVRSAPVSSERPIHVINKIEPPVHIINKAEPSPRIKDERPIHIINNLPPPSVPKKYIHNSHGLCHKLRPKSCKCIPKLPLAKNTVCRHHRHTKSPRSLSVPLLAPQPIENLKLEPQAPLEPPPLEESKGDSESGPSYDSPEGPPDQTPLPHPPIEISAEKPGVKIPKPKVEISEPSFNIFEPGPFDFLEQKPRKPLSEEPVKKPAKISAAQPLHVNKHKRIHKRKPHHKKRYNSPARPLTKFLDAKRQAGESRRRIHKPREFGDQLRFDRGDEEANEQYFPLFQMPYFEDVDKECSELF